MINISTRRLRFAQMGRSISWMSRVSGIPRSTMSNVLRGVRNLPSRYTSKARNFYQREAYEMLRDLGMPSHQSRRFSSFIPESVNLKAGLFDMKVKFCTKGWIAKTQINLEKQGVFVDAESLWMQGQEVMRNAMRKSKMPLENILKY